MCLHGAGGNQGVFDGIFDALKERHSVVAFDQPGHGRSGSLDSLVDIHAMARFTHELLTALEIESPVLFGHSMGGMVAIQYALTYPGEVSGLVLSASPAALGNLDEVIEVTRKVSEGKARRQFNREMYSPDATPEILQKGFMEDIKTDPRAQLGDMIACRDWSGTADASAISAPTLVVRGADEFEAVSERVDALAGTIPGARHAVIPGAAHKLPIEQPAALADAVTDFLGGLPS
ncbi:MAG: alpha/beta hydrolase [Myxococcota bacterium]